MQLPRSIQQRSTRRAFTLMEVLVVVAIIVVLAGIVIITALVYPSLETMYAQARVTAGADNFKAGLLTARARAVEEGVAYRVSIVLGKGNYRVAPERQSYWDGGGPSSSSDSQN